MAYLINGVELATDEEGYLLEADFGEESPAVIAAVDGIELTPLHWEVINYLRDSYREHGQSPSFRNMLKEMQALNPALDNKGLYDLFPMGPAKQGARIAGLPKPFGKGGY